MKVIIFDMYGVIMKAPEGDLIPFIHKYLPDVNDRYIESLWKEAAYGQMTSYEFFYNVGFDEERIKEIEKKYLDSIQIDAEFFSIAKYLKKDYKLVLLSNDIAEWSVYLRKKFGLDEFFEKIIISGDYGLLKPDSRLFHIILNAFDLPASEFCYIDDRERNLEAASRLGMKVILFNRRNVSYEGNIIYDFQELEKYLFSN